MICDRQTDRLTPGEKQYVPTLKGGDIINKNFADVDI